MRKPTWLLFLFQTALMLFLFFILFRHPQYMQKAVPYFFGGIFGLGIVIFAAVFGALAWRRFSPASFEKSGIKIAEKPSLGLVGSEGKGSRLHITETPDTLNVTWSFWDYALMLAITLLFGPILGGATLMDYHKILGQAPLVFRILLPLICAVAIAAFFSNLWKLLWHNPKLVVKSNCIEFYRGHALVKTFWSHEIKKLAIEEHTYICQSSHSGTSYPCPNFILTAYMEDGASERLCISDKKEQIEHLKSSVEQRIRLEPV